MTERRARGWLDRRFFTSRVARRVFGLMLVSALVPILSFALLSYQQVTRQLERDASARLEQDAKQVGMAVLERLLLLEASLASWDPAAARPAYFAERFRRIELRSTLELEPAEQSQLAAGGTLLRVSTGPAPAITLWRRTDTERWLAAELEPRFLFPPEALRATVDLRVLANGERGRPLHGAGWHRSGSRVQIQIARNWPGART